MSHLIDRVLPDVNRAVAELLRLRAIPVDQRVPGAIRTAETAIVRELLAARVGRYQARIDDQLVHVCITAPAPKVSVRLDRRTKTKRQSDE